MKRICLFHLFNKHYLVNLRDREIGTDSRFTSKAKIQDDPFEIAFSLAHFFGIKITSGTELLQKEMIQLAGELLGQDVPKPFYRNYPKSVLSLTPNQLLYDQLLNYAITYGLGITDSPRYSVFEKDFERTAFREGAEIREFSVITEEEAIPLLQKLAEELLQGTRPLSYTQYDLVQTVLHDYPFPVTRIASKDTAVRLLLDVRDPALADHIRLSDVIRLLDRMNFTLYGNTDLKKLNLRNKERVFLTAVIDRLIPTGNIVDCFEKKKLWNGLLHHLHYRAKTPEGQAFLDRMRGKENGSVYSAFEKDMSIPDAPAALETLRKGKGESAVLRNLNYILSRCRSEEEIHQVLQSLDSKNVLLMIQLLIQYSNYRGNGESRTFRFIRHEMETVHKEKPEEISRRRSVLKPEIINRVTGILWEKLRNTLSGRLGKVYVDPDMKRYALPIQEAASQGGFGVLTRGTLLPLPPVKKLRAFTYWELVDDIDLSVIGLTESLEQTEFSWRTMSQNQSTAITYSGDETSGYHGGSEYFDIRLDEFRSIHPETRYLVFCNNVFTGINFGECFCRAGYMLRDNEDSGEVYEPKTVQSAFRVDCESTFAYLFALDLKTNMFIWLNTAQNSRSTVAGTNDLSYLMDYFHVTDLINVASFFTMMATELVEDPLQADVVVTNRKIEVPEGTEVIREYDIERMIALMNQ